MTLLAFPEALKLAETADTPEKIKVCLDEIGARLAEATSALAVDSAYQIMKALTASFERVYLTPPA